MNKKYFGETKQAIDIWRAITITEED